MTAAEVGALAPRDRQRLMLEAVRLRDGERDWRALYGSFLSADERFLRDDALGAAARL
jgi:hypothetical protein